MYNKLKKDILGKKYSLSIAFISEKKSRAINKKYRKKDKPTNVLAFPLSKTAGEILLCKPVIRKEAKNFDKTFEEFLFYLVIHGMLHLKGMRHGSIMERAENKYDQKHFRRHRRGVRHDQGGGGRISKGRQKS
jgi:rRNA maturation RNase YbeY